MTIGPSGPGSRGSTAPSRLVEVQIPSMSSTSRLFDRGRGRVGGDFVEDGLRAERRTCRCRRQWTRISSAKSPEAVIRSPWCRAARKINGGRITVVRSRQEISSELDLRGGAQCDRAEGTATLEEIDHRLASFREPPIVVGHRARVPRGSWGRSWSLLRFVRQRPMPSSAVRRLARRCGLRELIRRVELLGPPAELDEERVRFAEDGLARWILFAQIRMSS